MKFRVGDRASQKGSSRVGTVQMVRSWIDSVKILSDAEAKLFVNDLKVRYGLDFADKWQHVYLSFRNTGKWFENGELVKHE